VPESVAITVQRQRLQDAGRITYGLALDLNPVEDPYVGCGMTRDRTALSYLDHSNMRRGSRLRSSAPSSVGWGWGGSCWATKDYMRCSYNGR
jgi:hypothetical protein